MTDYASFLQANSWGNAQQTPLAGDASGRRYVRLCSGPKRALLMIDPSDDTARFAALSKHLSSIGLSAPEIYARQPGLMLIEDFGDAQFAKVIETEPHREDDLYRAATDVLCHLEDAALLLEVPKVTPEILGTMIEPAFTHYLPTPTDKRDVSFHDIRTCLTDLLETNLPKKQVMVLRDHHAENMIWLPDRDGIRRVGLLDFQDALIGPPVYDLVSMLQDARRDVSDTCRDRAIAYYLDRTGRSGDAVLPVFHLLGIQRNLRILGVFARLAMERGKPGYLTLIPRVWGHILTSLNAPVARPLKDRVLDAFPTPTPTRLNKMRSSCLTP